MEKIDMKKFNKETERLKNLIKHDEHNKKFHTNELGEHLAILLMQLDDLPEYRGIFTAHLWSY